MKNGDIVTFEGKEYIYRDGVFLIYGNTSNISKEDFLEYFNSLESILDSSLSKKTTKKTQGTKKNNKEKGFLNL